MAHYYAVIRLVGASTPNKIDIIADGTMKAIDEMVRGAGVATTSEIEEWEIMEILEDGAAYRPVSSKGPKRPRKTTEMIVAPPHTPSVVEAVAALYDEIAYVPYQATVA